MKKETIKKIVVFVVVAILLLLCSVMLKNCATPKSLIKFEGNISNIRVEEGSDRVVINIDGVNVDFVWYESDISIDYSKNLKQGDSVIIFVQDNYNKVALARIYSFSVNGTLIFDKVQTNFEENKQLSYVFAVMIIALCATLLLCVFKPLKNEEQAENTFVIRSPKIVYYISICFCIPFISGALAAFIVGIFSPNALPAGFAFLAMGSLCGLLLYIYFAERFTFDGYEFVYFTPFIKPKRALVSELKLLRINRRNLIKVEFLDKNGEKLMSFLDDGTSFRTGEFSKVLKNLNIPIANSIYSARFETTKLIMKQIIIYENVNNLRIRLRIFGEEYLINCKKEGCNLQRLGGEILFTFANFEEFVLAPVFKGESITKQWKKVEAFDAIYDHNE